MNKLEVWDRLARSENGIEVEVDGLDLTEEFEEDFDAFGGGRDAADDAFHALEGAGSDLHLIADGDRRRDRY